MWIRSQDKETIVKANRIDVVVNTIRCCNNDDSIFIGEYSNREKALKVLGMIQTRIIENYSDRQVPYTEEKYNAYYVFQMPQDNEV